MINFNSIRGYFFVWFVLFFFLITQSEALKFSSPLLSSDDAFQVSFTEKDNDYQVSIQIAEGYYLYKERFEISSIKRELLIDRLPQGIIDKRLSEYELYTGNMSFLIDKDWITENKMTFFYQGCADSGFCYLKQSKVFLLKSN